MMKGLTQEKGEVATSGAEAGCDPSLRRHRIHRSCGHNTPKEERNTRSMAFKSLFAMTRYDKMLLLPYSLLYCDEIRCSNAFRSHRTRRRTGALVRYSGSVV